MTCPLCAKPVTHHNGQAVCQSRHCGYRFPLSTEVVL